MKSSGNIFLHTLRMSQMSQIKQVKILGSVLEYFLEPCDSQECIIVSEFNRSILNVKIF